MRGRSWRPSARRWCRRGPAGAGRPRSPYKVAPAGLNYATVHKTRKKGRVVEVATRVIFGTAATVAAALDASAASRTVNTAFVERHNGTDRNRNARKVRKTYCFSKDWWIHRAATFFSKYSYNFCWPVRTLKAKGGDGSDTGHDGEVGGSCVDASGVDQATGCSTCVGHDLDFDDCDIFPRRGGRGHCTGTSENRRSCG